MLFAEGSGIVKGVLQRSGEGTLLSIQLGVRLSLQGGVLAALMSGSATGIAPLDSWPFAPRNFAFQGPFCAGAVSDLSQLPIGQALASVAFAARRAQLSPALKVIQH